MGRHRAGDRVPADDPVGFHAIYDVEGLFHAHGLAFAGLDFLTVIV